VKLNPEKTIVFCVSLVAVSILIGIGKLPADDLKYFFVWLLQSPIEKPELPEVGK